jgi:hypothetical protein
LTSLKKSSPPALAQGFGTSRHVQIDSIPGFGDATAAALVAKIVEIDRFATP